MKLKRMILFPRAKINIGLRITGKRPDGYHNLQTIFYPVWLSDALEFVMPHEQLASDELKTSGFTMDCPPDKNLVMKALNKMRDYCQIPFLKIHLHKAIPFGAGLGGGSSDAATFIKGLNRYFNLGLSLDKMKDIALALGSDCPFFIEGVPVYSEGRGEITTPVNPMPGRFFLVLIKPPVYISTKEAYSECQPVMRDPDLPDFYKRDISEWKDLIFNDFERIIFLRYPEAGAIKDDLYKAGAIYSSLSGSGSAVYGIFRNKPVLPDSLGRYLIFKGLL